MVELSMVSNRFKQGPASEALIAQICKIAEKGWDEGFDVWRRAAKLFSRGQARVVIGKMLGQNDLAIERSLARGDVVRCIALIARNLALDAQITSRNSAAFEALEARFPGSVVAVLYCLEKKMHGYCDGQANLAYLRRELSLRNKKPKPIRSQHVTADM